MVQLETVACEEGAGGLVVMEKQEQQLGASRATAVLEDQGQGIRTILCVGMNTCESQTDRHSRA